MDSINTEVTFTVNSDFSFCSANNKIKKDLPKRTSFKSHFRTFNQKGEREYNMENIFTHLKNREGKGLVRDVCDIIGEERRDLLEKCYGIIGKDMFLGLLEKTLKIQNDGGVDKFSSKETEKMKIEEDPNLDQKEKKTTGGIFLKLIKTESGMSKQNIKDIFRIDYQSRNQRKKLIKKMEKLLLSNN
jgi:hypothetical protein